MIGKSEIGNVIVEQIDYRHSDGRLTVATYGSGVFQTTITSVDDVLSTKDIIETNVNIYPLPVNNILNIDLFSKSEEKIKCIFYNEVGKKIKISNRKVFNGNNNINFNVQDLKQGLYFITLHFEEESITKKFIKQ